MKHIDYFFYFFVIFIFYVHILPKVHHPIPYTNPLWHKNVFSPFENIAPREKVEVNFNRKFYHHKNNLFFYDNMGEITHRVKFDKNNKISVSDKNYIAFDHSLKKATLFKENGYALWSLDTSFYPFVSPSGNSIVFLSPTGMGFNIYNADRNKVLPLTYLDSMITDLNFCIFNDSFAISTMGGKAMVIDHRGKKLFDWQFFSSQHNYIKTIVSSEKGVYYLILAGLYPEYLILFKNNGDELWRRKTTIQRRRHLSLYVNSLNNQIIEPGRGDIYVRSLKNGRILYVLDLKDMDIFNIRYIVADSIKGMTIVGINGDSSNYVLLFDTQGKIFWKQKYHDDHLLHVEFSDDGKALMIHTSQNIFAYQLNQFN